MRKQTMVIVLALSLLCAFTLAYADEAVLIDFNQLKADIKADPANQGKFLDNRATMMDFSGTAGASYTDEQKKQMQTSLAIGNWDVLLASSSKSNLNQSLSNTAEATVLSTAKRYGGQTVMGFRVHFPVADYNSWAKIVPPFEVPAFAPKATIDDTGAITESKDAAGDPADPNTTMTRFEGKYDANAKITYALGVVKNVGVIKQLAVDVKGLNFPHGLSLILRDADGNEQTVFMGYLNFDGWKTLTWQNPAYIEDVRNRELRIYPLYPNSTPMVKFAGFLITRDAAHEGGDFVCYVKDVKVLYDEAVPRVAGGMDINDEQIWGIVGKKEAERQNIESKRFGSQQVLRFLEKTKQESKTTFTDADAGAAPAKK